MVPVRNVSEKLSMPKKCSLLLLSTGRIDAWYYWNLSWGRTVTEDFLKEVTFYQRSEAKCQGKELQAE